MAQAEKSKVMSIGWTCFWVGVAIMLLIHTSILFSGPFFLAAFITEYCRDYAKQRYVRRCPPAGKVDRSSGYLFGRLRFIAS